MKNHPSLAVQHALAAALLITLAPTAAHAQAEAPDYVATLTTAATEADTAAKKKRDLLRVSEDFLRLNGPKVRARIADLRSAGSRKDLIEAGELERMLGTVEAQTATLRSELETADRAAADAAAKQKIAERLLKAANSATPGQVQLAVAEQTKEDQARGRMEADRRAAGKCSLDEPLETFDPVACLPEGPAVGTITIGDRPLQRQGLSAQLTSTGTASAVTLRYADTFAIAGPRPNSGWKNSAWGWNIGVATSTAKDADTAFVTRLSETDKTRRLFESDRLDERVKLLFGLVWNSFREKSEDEHKATVDAVVETAERACKVDPLTSSETQCARPVLFDWIDRNPAYRQALNDAYWGSAKAQPVWGAGLQFELGYPRFKYIDLNLAQIAAGGELPAAFLAADPTKDRKLQATVLSYLFFTHGDRSSFVPSFTYKRAWTIPEASKDISVCARDPDLAAFKDPCSTLNIAAPVLENSYFLGMEWRHFGGGVGILPAFGIAPRYTLELDRGRHSFDMPIWLALDEKQTNLNAGIRLIAGAGGETPLGEKRKAELGLAFFLGTNFSLTAAPK